MNVDPGDLFSIDENPGACPAFTAFEYTALGADMTVNGDERLGGAEAHADKARRASM